MRALTSIWSQYVNRLFGTSRGIAPLRRADRRLRRRDNAPLYSAAEVLEVRSLLSAPSLASAVGIGSVGGDSALDVATDGSSNTYMAGFFSGTVDFDPGSVHAGDTDIKTSIGAHDLFVAKYGPDGSFLWVGQMGGVTGTSSVARTVTTDTRGNVYIAGDFTGTVNFGTTTLTSAGDKDGFVAKLDSDGNVLWADRWGSADKEYVNGIAVDGAGNVFAAGSTLKLNPDGSQAYCNIQVEKFSAVGTALWAKQIGNANGGNGGASGIGTDTAGNVYVSGAFSGKVDFDPGTATHFVQGTLNDNGFVLKLTAAGNFGWVSPFVNQNSTSSSNGCDLAVDGSNNIVVGGDYRGTVDFDPGKGTQTLPSGGGGFIAKLNSAGSLIWAQQAGSGAAAVHSLALDVDGNIYAQGLFQNQSDFDPGTGTNILTSNGSTDVFVTKYSASGVYQWAVSFGGTGTDGSNGIAVDAAGNVYVAGLYYNTVDFDPDPFASDLLTSAGANDAFLVKFRQS